MNQTETWTKLIPTIKEILNPTNQLSVSDYMSSYTLIHNFCTSFEDGQDLNINLGGSDLYYSLEKFLIDYVISLPFTNLENYTRNWRIFKQSSKMLHHLFQYLNRMWIKRKLDELQPNIYDINTLCLVCWRDYYLKLHNEKIVGLLLDCIEMEREGGRIDSLVMETVIQSFVTLGIDSVDFKKRNLQVYQDNFENMFLEKTKEFYREKGKKMVSELSCTEYLKRVERYLEAEDERVKKYLDVSTSTELIPLVEKLLLFSHQEFILSQFIPYLERDQLDDLERMYRLLSRVPETLLVLRDQFQSFVREQGLLAVEKLQVKEPQEYADALLQVYTKYHRITISTFDCELGFETALDKACRDFVNVNSICSNTMKSSEFIAKYSDSILRRKSKVSQDGDIEDKLNGILAIFKFLQDKDIFQQFYMKFLAKRLVNNVSGSDDGEALMISKLKEQCGYEYTSKLQRMFTDISISKELNQSFKYFLLTRDFGLESQVEFSILLVPFYERFMMFYSERHQGRKLNWLIQLSKGELKTGYLAQGFILTVSTYQMGILLLYNTKTSCTFDELLNGTGLKRDILEANLQLLLKAKILTKTNDYDLNFEFKSKKLKINLNVAIKSDSKQESEETLSVVQKDRELVVQAAIVRIMKTRKVLKHVQLVQEVIQQLQNRFQPQISTIKKSIDVLLEKEYIERVQGQYDMFSYVA